VGSPPAAQPAGQVVVMRKARSLEGEEGTSMLLPLGKGNFSRNITICNILKLPKISGFVSSANMKVFLASHRML